MGANTTTVNLRSIKSNKSNLNLDLMNIKLETSSLNRQNEIIIKEEYDEDESMHDRKDEDLDDD